MEANGLSKSNLPFVAIGGEPFGRTSAIEPNSDAFMSDVATALAPSTPDRSTVLRVVRTSMDNYAPVAITPTCSRDHSDHHHQETLCETNGESSANVSKGVRDNVATAQARVRDVEDRIARQHQQQVMAMLKTQLFAEKVCLIDALVVMAWEHYRISVEESSSYETAETAVKHIFEEALDVSIRLFCSDPLSSSPLASMNLDRLMILLMVLDFDEYCETLLQYQLAREHMVSEGVETSTRQRLEVALRPTGEKHLQQLHELWKRGVFDRFDATAGEEEEGFAKLHATGLCLVLFRQLESRVGNQTTDLTLLQEQFRVIFDDYLPTQLTQRPSMNNIVATKHSRLLFADDGSPTVYWSLLADSYRKEWADYFDQDEDHTSDMDTDDEDEDDGL